MLARSLESPSNPIVTLLHKIKFASFEQMIHDQADITPRDFCVAFCWRCVGSLSRRVLWCHTDATKELGNHSKREASWIAPKLECHPRGTGILYPEMVLVVTGCHYQWYRFAGHSCHNTGRQTTNCRIAGLWSDVLGGQLGRHTLLGITDSNKGCRVRQESCRGCRGHWR